MVHAQSASHLPQQGEDHEDEAYAREMHEIEIDEEGMS